MIKPIKFTEGMVEYGADQPEYLPLPVLKSENGTLLICWKFGIRERLRLLFTGKLWHYIYTFNTPLQPTLLTVEKPELGERKDA